jgi:hypothetical protein
MPHTAPATSAQAAATARVHQVARFLIAAGTNPAQVGKAVALIELGGLTPAETPGTWLATATDRSTAYLTGTTFCTCPATRHCYHTLAAIIRVAVDAVPHL